MTYGMTQLEMLTALVIYFRVIALLLSLWEIFNRVIVLDLVLGLYVK